MNNSSSKQGLSSIGVYKEYRHNNAKNLISSIQECRLSRCPNVITEKEFISVVGDIDYQQVKQKHGEIFVRACLDRGNSPATVAKKPHKLKRTFQLAVDRGQ
jgi:hypothetical protein